MCCPVRDNADCCFFINLNFRLWQPIASCLKFSPYSIYILRVIIRPFAIRSPLVVTWTSEEIRRHFVTRYGPIRHAVSIHIVIASEFTNPFKRFFVQHLATINWFGWIFKWLRHPGVHPKVKVSHHKYRRLKMFCQIKRFHPHRITLFRRRRKQH